MHLHCARETCYRTLLRRGRNHFFVVFPAFLVNIHSPIIRFSIHEVPETVYYSPGRLAPLKSINTTFDNICGLNASSDASAAIIESSARGFGVPNIYRLCTEKPDDIENRGRRKISVLSELFSVAF